jgi:hypothetical protein
MDPTWSAAMMSSSASPYPYNPFWWLPAGNPVGDAPPDGAPSAGLVQPILPGWSFGNVVVNEANSNAPDTEQRIVAQKSYGLQIGVLLDAVTALAKDPGREKAQTRKALAALETLEKQVEAIKAEAARARVDRIEADLDSLRGKPGQAEYEEVAVRLQAYLTKHAPKKPT